MLYMFNIYLKWIQIQFLVSIIYKICYNIGNYEIYLLYFDKGG